jgi:hypothetical protein
MSLTTDSNDPKLKEWQKNETGQHEIYLVLSEEERAKGFVRLVRNKYVHVGIGGHEINPNDMSKHGRTGKACGVLTIMGQALAETYSRDPKFYSATYCTGCQKHLPVDEFIWDGTNETVGS